MLLEIDFAKKKKKPTPPMATVMSIHRPDTLEDKKSKKKKDEHLTLSI